jgi:endonuclease/exonuclease/phosphatase family metal-dependent hydrolase
VTIDDAMSSTSHQLRVCSYNIHKGFNATNIRPILQDLRHAIRATDADLVFLQEVVGERLSAVTNTANLEKQGNSYPQFEYLADEVWPHHAYGRNAIYQKGHHGNAILSKNPFLGWDNVNVSQWWFSQRGILFGKIDQGIYLVCVHFGLFAGERRKQLQQVLELLSKQVPNDQPVIIAGDFNDWTGDLHRRLTGELQYREAYTDVFGRPARTFPARLPILAMDRIYYRNLRLLDAEVLSGATWQRLSDHRALYAMFDLQQPVV